MLQIYKMSDVQLIEIAPGVKKVVRDRGLGDTIERFTRKTGIKAVVEKISEVTGVDCGCAARQSKLNELVPYNN